MRCIEYVYYKDELMIGDKNDEEERQCRVGNDNPQEDAHGRTDYIAGDILLNSLKVFNKSLAI